MALRRVVIPEDYNKLLCKNAEETGDVHRCCLLFRMEVFNLKVVLTVLWHFCGRNCFHLKAESVFFISPLFHQRALFLLSLLIQISFYSRGLTSPVPRPSFGL